MFDFFYLQFAIWFTIFSTWLIRKQVCMKKITSAMFINTCYRYWHRWHWTLRGLTKSSVQWWMWRMNECGNLVIDGGEFTRNINQMKTSDVLQPYRSSLPDKCCRRGYFLNKQIEYCESVR